MKYITTILISIIFLSCGSKKINSKKNIEKKTDIELKDTSSVVSKLETERELVNTNIKERIVTMYSVRFDTIYIEGERTIIPIVFPSQMEELRDISTSNYVWRLKAQDSIKNALELKYKAQLNEKEETITKIGRKSKTVRVVTVTIIALLLLYVLLKFRYRVL